MRSADAASPVTTSISIISDRLRQLERRDWWLWSVGALILVALCALVWSFSLPALHEYSDHGLQEQLNTRIKGLCGIVVLFTGFLAYQQHLIKRLRLKLQTEIAFVSELHGRSEAAHELTILDPLTGLFNRRFISDYLPREIARCERDRMSLVALMIDIDGFRRLNEQYGHTIGDEVLRQFAYQIKKSIRSADVPVRMGGDEFLVILPECDANNAKRPLERLQACEVALDGALINVRFSVGIAQHRPGDLAGELLRRADEALYQEKRTIRHESLLQ